jgi:hypothetical protein
LVLVVVRVTVRIQHIKVAMAAVVDMQEESIQLLREVRTPSSLVRQVVAFLQSIWAAMFGNHPQHLAVVAKADQLSIFHGGTHRVAVDLQFVFKVQQLIS